MSFLTSLPAQTCKNCRSELAAGSLSCPRCHSLVHAEELERLAVNANALQVAGQIAAARETWLKALDLLPPDSAQAEWIRSQARGLESAAKDTQTDGPKPKWVNKLGPLAPVAMALAKGKALLAIFNLKFLLSLAAFMGFYWSLYGKMFGIGFAVLIVIHEMGHFIEVKRRGLPAEMPVFLPGLGAYVRWQALGVSGETRAAVSLAGPFAGWLAAVACAVVWWKTGAGIWAALARAGAWLNVLNLIPVWILDGGQAVLVMNRIERIALLTACLALWLFLGESVFFLVAAGATWRLFTKDAPTKPSLATTAYYVGVLASLGMVMWLMPGRGFGTP